MTLLALATFSAPFSTAFAQGTAFSYQGRLNDGGNPANGIYDVRFTVYDSTNAPGNIISGPITNSATAVSNGLFSVTLDFGAGVFTGPDRCLQLDVRTNGTATFTALSPRQPLLPVPYTVMANTASNLLGTLPAAQLSGTLPANLLAAYSGTVSLTNGGNSFNGCFGGSGAGLTNVPGSVAWQNVTGASQQAQPNTGYLANNPAQVTITLPTTPNVGDIVRVSGVGSGGWLIAQNAGQSVQAGAFGINYTNWINFTNWMQTSAPIGNWYAVVSSADGTKLAAALDSNDFGGAIYTSTDSGVTWSLSGAPTIVWGSLASSADGTKLFAGSYDGYVSTNSGLTWTFTGGYSPGGGFLYWCYDLASSTDGSKLVALWEFDPQKWAGIATSTDSGATWTQTSAPTNNWWTCVASSADGSKLVAVVNGGGIYTSADSGVTWTETSGPGANWCDCSADGTKLVAVVGGDGIYTSANSGASWTQTSAPSQNWTSVASSADGSKLAAIAGNTSIYISTDSGVTWIQTGAPSPNGGQFQVCSYRPIALSADGSKLVVVVNGGGIWTAQATIQTTSTPGTAGYLAGGQNSAIELQYTGNGLWLPLSYVGTISAF